MEPMRRERQRAGVLKSGEQVVEIDRAIFQIDHLLGRSRACRWRLCGRPTHSCDQSERRARGEAAGARVAEQRLGSALRGHWPERVTAGRCPERSRRGCPAQYAGVGTWLAWHAGGRFRRRRHRLNLG
eukprot:scaffold332_cov105-Isochrysis_galbana.AAC.4